MGFLVKHHKNMIYNLTTKDSLSYTDLKQWLMDIETSDTPDDTVLFTSKPSGNKRKGKKPRGNSDSFSPKLKTCTWCKKHNPGKSEGHTWNECFRVQELNKERKEKEKHEEANITTETNVRTKSFYFDTA